MVAADLVDVTHAVQARRDGLKIFLSAVQGQRLLTIGQGQLGFA